MRIFPTGPSKSVPNVKALHRFEIANRALATVLRTFCQQPSQIEPPNRGNRDLTAATPEATFPKKHRVSRPRVFPPVNSRVPMMMGGDMTMVDMMVGMLTMTIVRNSEVFELKKLF